MNLITTPWIPVRRRKGGDTEYICPWQLTEGHGDNPIVAVDFPRPDLSSSVVTFLIGVLQLVLTPENSRRWHSHYEQPPEPGVLKAVLMAFADSFQIDGDGSRCFQDLKLTGGTEKPISALLIDQPGEQATKNNSDLFIKREQFSKVGLSASIAALITMQTSAPSGGQGHRTSMRGGGPLNTILIPDARNDELDFTLWRVCWLNVLDGAEVESLTGNSTLDRLEFKLPWLAPTRTSEAEVGVATFPEHGHSLQMYFGMPRRIRLNLQDLESGTCPLTLRNEPLVESYQTQNYGVNYEGAWQHPLSPHRFDPDGLPIPLHPQPGGIGYRNWLHLTLGKGQRGESGCVQPARVITSGLGLRKARRQTLVWSFGYNMDKMKARGWYESTMPIFHLDADENALLAARAEALIDAAQEISGNLRQAVRKAWFSDGATVKGDLSFITQSFWQNTESRFFQTLQTEYDALAKQSEEPDRSSWLSNLHTESLKLFDHFAVSGNIAFENPKRIAVARRNLTKFNFKRSIKDKLRISSLAT